MKNKFDYKSCFAYNKDSKECNCLVDLVCQKNNCRFYKHKKDVNLAKIDYDCSQYQKYYNGYAVKGDSNV